MLKILSEWCQDVMTYGHLMTEDLPYKPLFSSVVRLETLNIGALQGAIKIGAV